MLGSYKGKQQDPHFKLDTLELNSFSDSNNTTTTLQVRPKYIYQSTPFTFISPFRLQSPLFFKQALFFPLDKRHSFGIQSQVFQRKEGNIRSVGLVYEYTDIHDSKIVAKGSFGTLHSCSLEYHKRFDKRRIVSVYCSSSVLMKTFYNSCGLGYKYGRFQTILTQKIGFGGVLKATYKYPLYKGIILKLETSGTLLPETSQKIVQSQISLNYSIHKVKGSLIANVAEHNSLRIQFQTRTSIGKIFICNEYVNEQNIIYLGFKRHNCKLAIPVAASNSIAVTVMFGIAYLIGFFLRKDTKQVQAFKSDEQRMKQLRLIENKANENYNHEVANKGLLIKTAFYGQQSVIEEMYQKFQSPSLKYQQPGELTKIIETTVPLRYYTYKGKLKLVQSSKSKLLGFCDIDASSPKLLIEYQKGGSEQIYIKMFNDCQLVQI